MKRRIHIELLVTSGLAILLTLTFAMFVFYGLFLVPDHPGSGDRCTGHEEHGRF